MPIVAVRHRDWQRKNSLTPLAVITKHKQYQTDNGRSWFASHTGSVAVRRKRRPGVTSSYVKPGAVQHLNFSLFAAHCCLSVAVCPLWREGRPARCHKWQSLPAVHICIYTRFAFACVLYNTGHRQRLCQHSRPGHSLLSYCKLQPSHENGCKPDSCQV